MKDQTNRLANNILGPSIVLTPELRKQAAERFLEAQRSAENDIMALFREMVIALEGSEPTDEEVTKHAYRVSGASKHWEHWTWKKRIIFTVFDPFHVEKDLKADREFVVSFAPSPGEQVQLTWSVVVPRGDMTAMGAK